ncbi:MAG: ATP-dependent DNA helicase [Actinobacteria bacterium]|nr:ATP-dependent DNA helicase [Actinomycetota bacterium]
MPATPVDALTVLERSVAALGGDDRPGQQALTEAIATAIESGHHLVAEAPTGSGKSLAYLAAALAAGRRAVVATATLALQDQLWHKDLPHLEAHAGVDFHRALLKGRSNYLCLARLEAARGDDALFDERPAASFTADLPRLQKFANDSETGDVADLPSGIDPASWRLVTCGPHECPGATRCDSGDSCFAELARMEADGVEVLVVNHALYCAHLATEGRLLPEHDLVIFDEAHALDRTATNALGTDLSAGGLHHLAARLGRVNATETAVNALHASAERLDLALDELEGRVDPSQGRIAELLVALGEQLAVASRSVDKDKGALGAHAVRLAGSQLEAVRRLQSPADTDVVWVEGIERRSLRLAPVRVGPRLAPVLFSQVPTVLLSATLGPGARFEPLTRALGLDPDADLEPEEVVEADGERRTRPSLGYEALRIDSPFDHREQAMLYVPRDLPDVRSADWEQLARDELCELVGAAGGRTLVLCTSWRVVHSFSEVLRERTEHKVLVQGEDPAAQLIEQFSADETSCLVATRAFWMGLDVPGPSCVLVVIDRLPFARPDEPLEQARREDVERAGGNGFRDVDLPGAALVLSQGAGRLVRSVNDCGVVAVLDRRLATAGYRKVLLDALPPMRRVVDRDVVCDFLAKSARPVA